MNNNQERLKQIETENTIWFIYFFIIGLCLYGNKFEEKYFKYNDLAAREKYRKINTLIFTIAVIIYFYFFIDNYNEYKKLNCFSTKTKVKYTNLSMLASTLILISGLIFLYIAITDINLETEISFN